MRTVFLHYIAPPRKNRKFLVTFNYLARQIFASGQQSSKEREREQTEDGWINQTMGQGSVKVRRQLCPERRRGRVTHGAAGKVSRVSRLLGVKCMNIIFADLVMAYCNSPSDLGYVEKPCQVESIKWKICKSKKSIYQVLKAVLPP